MRQTLFPHIADRIKKDIAADYFGSSLPSMHILAQRYEVSIVTIGKALRKLAEEGLIDYRWGRKTAIRTAQQSDQGAALLASSDSSAAPMYSRLRSEIVLGNRKAGQALPKIEYFARQYRVGRAAVSAMLRKLEAEKLIHKERMKWVVGPRQMPGHIKPVGSKPVVLLVFPDFSLWHSDMIAQQKEYALLGRSFIAELEEHGYVVQQAYSDEREADASCPKGIAQIQEFILSLGTRYAGTLLHCSPDLAPLARMLTRFKKPVVAFQHPFTRIELGNEPLYAFCSHEWIAPIELALQSLVQTGHRYVAVPYPGSDILAGESGFMYRWTRLRLKQIQQSAAALNCAIEIIPVEQHEPLWYMLSWIYNENAFSRDLSTRLTALQEQHSRRKQTVSTVQVLRHLSPSLAAIVDHPQVTAILALNDLLGRLFYEWFKQAGIIFPHHFSFLSFDNDPRSHFFPISTIDLGFEKMGYCAAHWIIRDIPVKVARDGGISVSCTLIDRGSLGPPSARKSPK